MDLVEGHLYNFDKWSVLIEITLCPGATSDK
jgi:hypothetical protein